MFALIVTEKGGTPQRHEFDKDEVTIGRVPGNDIVLPKGNVSKRHSRVIRQDGRFFVVDLKSTNGTYLNGRRITTPSPLRPGDKIYIGDFVLMLDLGDEGHAVAGPPAGMEEMSEPPGPEFAAPSDPGMSAVPAPEPSAVEPLPLDEEPPESSPPPPLAAPSPGRPMGVPVAPSAGPVGSAMRPGMLTQPLGSALSHEPPLGASPGNVSARPTQPPPRVTGAGGVGAVAGRSAGPAMPGPGVPRRTLAGVAPPGVPPSAPLPTSPGRPAVARAGVPGPSVPSVEKPRTEGAVRVPTPSGPAVPGRGFESEPVQESVPQPGTAPAMPPVASVSAAPAVSALSAPGPEGVAVSGPRSVVPTSGLSLGAEYAAVLGEVIQEARAAGAVAPPGRMADAATRARVRSVVEGVVRKRDRWPEGITAEQLVRDATAEIAGAGAIETALEDPAVTTVIVDPNGRVLLGRGEGVSASPLWFSSQEAVLAAVDRLLDASGASRAPDGSVVEATLVDGARLLAVLPPLVASGPSVVIERPSRHAATLEELVARGVLSSPAATMLEKAIAARRNVIVTGPVGSGRTMLAAALVSLVCRTDRCVVVEGRREIGAMRLDVVALEASGEWKQAIALAVRLRPQRLVFGEMNADTANALVSMLATGSEGCIAVGEGPVPEVALVRLAALAASVGTLARDECVSRLAATRPLVVHMARLGDGSCRVVSVGEARGGDNGGIQVDQAFALRIENAAAAGRLGATLASTGVVPGFAESL